MTMTVPITGKDPNQSEFIQDHGRCNIVSFSKYTLLTMLYHTMPCYAKPCHAIPYQTTPHKFGGDFLGSHLPEAT